MWNDWHADVRKSAAQCLGKTGHGRDVHDDLRARILDGSERVKLEAISKVGQLGSHILELFKSVLWQSTFTISDTRKTGCNYPNI